MNQDLFQIRADLKAFRICVLIPAYNNAASLPAVIAGVLQFTDDIILINDGSTDGFNEVLTQYPEVKCISYTPNKGKGWALRTGFQEAGKFFDYVITIDADGQHYPEDIPRFLHKIKDEPGSIIIGARNMEQESVPGKSSFGHKFSNFWFRVETGIKAPDTQSGFRLYPLKPLSQIRFFTRKYEFEIEVLVRAAWKGVPITSVPVSVYYAPKETRVSHFRPFKDFSRISILNTVLVIITFLYIKPRNFFRMLSDKKKLNEFFREHLLQPGHSDLHKALSVAFGTFMAIIPIWGIQLGTAIFFAIILKLNKPLVILAANLSLPPMIPLIIFASYKAGAMWMGDHPGTLEFSSQLTSDSVRTNLAQYLYGSITLAILAAIVFGFATFGLLKLFRRKTILAG